MTLALTLILTLDHRCDAPEHVSDGPECPISPRNPWGSSVPLYADDTIVEQPVDHRTLHARYADYAEGFLRATQACNR